MSPARRPTRGALRRGFARLAGRRIAVFGDAMLDEFLWGDATRISPEAPVPVVLLERRTWSLGGAANVAANVAALGGRAFLFSAAGADDAGARLRALLASHAIAAEGVLTLPDRPTTVKHRVFARNKHLLRFDHEVAAPVPAAVTRAWLRRLAGLRGQVDAVVIADYAKGCVSQELVRGIASFCRSARLPWCVDPKLPGLRYPGATVLKPNLTELRLLSGLSLSDAADLAPAAARVLRQQRCENLLVTRGQAGMALFAPRRKPRHFNSGGQAVSDVTGAGDTVSAALALALAAGLPIARAATLANLAAGYVVTLPGTAVAERERLLAHLES